MFKDRDTLKSSDIYDKKKKKNKQEDTIGYKECSPKHQLREKREFQKSKSRNRKKSYHEVKI